MAEDPSPANPPQPNPPQPNPPDADTTAPADTVAEFDAYRRRRTLRRRVAAVTACLLVLALAGWYLVRITRDGPVDVVRDYLAALRDRKVATAMKIVGLRRPPGAAGAFLTAKAMTGGWRIATLRDSTDYFAGKDEATVDATLADTTHGAVDNPQMSTGRFHLVRRDGSWRITNPFAEVRFLNTPLWYVEVGGVRLPRRSYPVGAPDTGRVSKEDDPRPITLLFPGIYAPYAHSGTELVTVTAARFIALPESGSGSGAVTYAPSLKPTQRMRDLVQDAARTFVDTCLADLARDSASCRPLQSNDFLRSSKEILAWYEITKLTWHLTRYPTVGLPGWSDRLPSGLAAFSSQVTVPGEFQLTADGTDSSKHRPVTVDQSCLTVSYRNAWGTTIGIDATGAPVVTWTNPDPDGRTARPSTRSWLPVTCFGDEGE